MAVPRSVAGADPALVVGGVAALAVLAPLLRPGLALTYDMVFVPDQPLIPPIIGLDGVVARAVPSDLVLALLSRVTGIGLTQRVVLAAIVVLGAWGAGRLAAGWGRAAVAATSLFFVWNAFVFERLALGQWALLVAMAALPWAVRAADDVRKGAPARRVLVPVGLGALGAPAGGVIVVAVAVLVAAWGFDGREQVLRAVRVAGLGVGLCLWWLVPSLLRDEPVPASADGVAAFAARADTPLGTLGSLLTLGGAWNADVVPAGRDTWYAVPGLLLLTTASLVGCVLLVRLRWPLAWPLLTAAAAGLVLAAAATIPVGAAVTDWIVVEIPGGGLLRDAQKWIAPLVLVQALGLGAVVGRAFGSPGLEPRAPRLDRTAPASKRAWMRPVALVAVILPVLVLPGMALGLSGRLEPTEYPADYEAMRTAVDAGGGDGAVLALPWSSYRRPWWTATPMLGSVPRWPGHRVVASDALVVGDVNLPLEDPYAVLVDPVVESGTSAELARLGVRWVVVEKDAGGPEPREELLEGATPVLDGPALTLYELPAPSPPPTFGPARIPVLVGDAVAAGLLLWGAVAAATAGLRREVHPPG